MKMLMPHLAVFARIATYVVGFANVVVVSAALGAEDFGRFSILQSIIELSLVFATVGASSSLMRATVKDQSLIDRSAWIKLSLAGLVLCIFFYIFAAPALFYWELWRGEIILGALITSLLLAFGQASTAQLKLFDHGRSSTLEPLLRLTISCSVVAILIYFGHLLRLYELVFLGAACALTSSGVVYAYLRAVGRSVRFTAILPLSLRSSSRDILVSCVTFANRKADVLIVGIFSSLSYVAIFKICFLVCEAPLQLFQAHLNSKLKLITGESSYAGLLAILRRAAISIFILELLGCASLYVFDFLKGARYFELAVLLAPYFLFRAYAMVVETYLIANVGVAAIAKPAIASAATKAAFVAASAVLALPLPIGFLFAGMAEMVLYEIAIWKQCRVLPLRDVFLDYKAKF